MITSSGVPQWGGFFAPIKKHRDYQHNSFAEHEADNGATYRILYQTVEENPLFGIAMCDVDPVTEETLDPPELYYIVEVTLHDESVYNYLVEAESDRSEPNNKRIMDTMNAYARNPIPGGRNIYDYIDPLADFPDNIPDNNKEGRQRLV